MESVQDVVQQYLGALGSRNLDGLLALVAPAVEWDLPGNQNLVPWLGKRSDRAGVRVSFELLWAAIEPISMTLQHMYFADQHCVITGELASRMRATGKVKDEACLILAAEPDSTIALGAVRAVTHDVLHAASRDGSIGAPMD